MSHEAICPCNLQCNFCRKKKHCRLQLGCQTYATCFATCNEIIFYTCQALKHVSGILIMSYCDWFLLKKLRDKLQLGVSHAATCHVALRRVEAASTFSATCNAIFRCQTSCKHGVSHEDVFLATCNATPLRCKLQGKLPRVTWPLDHGINNFIFVSLYLSSFPLISTFDRNPEFLAALVTDKDGVPIVKGQYFICSLIF